MLCGVKFINIGVEHVERVSIPQRAHKLSLALPHRLAVKPLRQPGGAAHVEIPADGVRSVGGKGVERIHRISLGFAHLLAVLILHVAHDDYVLKGRLVEDQGGDGKQGVEPASGLVHRLGDKICRELGFKQLLVLKGIVMLGKGHGAGIKPAVDYLRNTVHLLAAHRAGDGHLIDVGTVKLDVVRAVLGHAL